MSTIKIGCSLVPVDVPLRMLWVPLDFRKLRGSSIVLTLLIYYKRLGSCEFIVDVPGYEYSLKSWWS